jgi:hypothetical protein
MSDEAPVTTDSGVQAPATVPEVKVEEAKAPSVKKYKVNGKEVEIPLDKLDYYAQMGLSATEKFQASAKIQKEIDSLKSEVKNPKQFLSALTKLGLSKEEARSTLEEALRAEYEWEDMSPEQKAAQQEKEELEQYRRQKEEMERKAKEEQLSTQQQADMQQLEGEMFDALSASSLPKVELFAKAAFNYMAAAAAKDIDIDAKQAVKLVETDFQKNIRSSLSGMDAKGIKAFLGEDVVKALLKDSVAEVRQKEAPFTKQAPAAVNQDAAKAQPKSEDSKPKPNVQSNKDFFQKLRGF